MNNFVVSEDACDIVKTNLSSACKIMKECGINYKRHPDVAVQILSQMYAIESVLQQELEPAPQPTQRSGCCQSAGVLKIV